MSLQFIKKGTTYNVSCHYNVEVVSGGALASGEAAGGGARGAATGTVRRRGGEVWHR